MKTKVILAVLAVLGLVAILAKFPPVAVATGEILTNHFASYYPFTPPAEPNWKERKAYWRDQFACQVKETEWVKFVEDGLRSDREGYAKALDAAYVDLIADVESKRDAALNAKGIEVKGYVSQILKKDVLLEVASGIPIGREDYYWYTGGIVVVKGLGPSVVDGAQFSGHVKLFGTCTYTTVAGPSKKVLCFDLVSPPELKRCDKKAGFLSDRLAAISAERQKEVAKAGQTGAEIDEELRAGEADVKALVEQKMTAKALAEAKAREQVRLAREAKDKADAIAEFQAKERAEAKAAVKADAYAAAVAQVAAKAKEAAARAKAEEDAAALVDDLTAKKAPPAPVQEAPQPQPKVTPKVVFLPPVDPSVIQMPQLVDILHRYLDRSTNSAAKRKIINDLKGKTVLLPGVAQAWQVERNGGWSVYMRYESQGDSIRINTITPQNITGLVKGDRVTVKGRVIWAQFWWNGKPEPELTIDRGEVFFR